MNCQSYEINLSRVELIVLNFILFMNYHQYDIDYME